MQTATPATHMNPPETTENWTDVSDATPPASSSRADPT